MVQYHKAGNFIDRYRRNTHTCSVMAEQWRLRRPLQPMIILPFYYGLQIVPNNAILFSRPADRVSVSLLPLRELQG